MTRQKNGQHQERKTLTALRRPHDFSKLRPRLDWNSAIAGSFDPLGHLKARAARPIAEAVKVWTRNAEGAGVGRHGSTRLGLDEFCECAHD